MGFEPKSLANSSLPRSRASSTDSALESGSDSEQAAGDVTLPGGQGAAAGPLETLSQGALQDAFSQASFGTAASLTPRDLLTMKRSNRLLSRIAQSPNFWQPWGYRNEEEATRLLEFLDEGRKPDQHARTIFAPLCRWARDGRVDKARFLHIRNEPDLRKFFELAHKENLGDDEIWRIVELEASLSARHWSDLADDGDRLLLVPYAQGRLSLEHLNAIRYQGNTRSLPLAYALFEAGTLPQDWKEHLRRLTNGGELIAAVSGRIDPRLYDALTGPGIPDDCRWDARGLCSYYGVSDLSRLEITEEDSARCDFAFGEERQIIPDTVENRAEKQWYCVDDHALLTEVGRRLQRQGPSAQARNVEPPEPVGPSVAVPVRGQSGCTLS